MKLDKVLLIAAITGLAFTSCKNNEREIDDVNCVEIEDDRDEDLRTGQQGMNDENSVSARLQGNQNLSTFNEGWTRNQVSQDLNKGTTTQAGTTTTKQSGTNSGPNQ